VTGGQKPPPSQELPESLDEEELLHELELLEEILLTTVMSVEGSTPAALWRDVDPVFF